MCYVFCQIYIRLNQQHNYFLYDIQNTDDYQIKLMFSEGLLTTYVISA